MKRFREWVKVDAAEWPTHVTNQDNDRSVTENWSELTSAPLAFLKEHWRDGEDAAEMGLWHGLYCLSAGGNWRRPARGLNDVA